MEVETGPLSLYKGLPMSFRVSLGQGSAGLGLGADATAEDDPELIEPHDG